MSTMLLNGEPDDALAEALRESLDRAKVAQQFIKADRAAGEAALRRLMPIARRNTGQSRRVAMFLLGLYNGYRFPFNLSELRGLDYEVMDDCLAVLRMDTSALQEVHLYFENGSAVFETLARDWGMEGRAE